MMLFSVYDRIDQKWTGPFPAVNKASAIRQFKISVANAPNDFVSDYDLFYLGDVDDKTGVLTPLEPNGQPEFVYRMEEGASNG